MKKKSLFVISPPHYDHSLAAIVEGLNKLDEIKVFSNTNHNYFKQPLSVLKTQIQVAKMADYVMLCHSALESKYEELIGPLINEARDEINIFLDGSDYSEYQDNPDKYKLYFKREFTDISNNLFNKEVHKNVVPISFAAEDRHFTKPTTFHSEIWENKKDDVVCIMSACEKRPHRFGIMETLDLNFKGNDKVFVGEYREGETLDTVDTGERHFSGYFQKLLNAKISVDAYGCGNARQTGRFWESLANGCLVFYQPIEPSVWSNPYIDGEDFIVYKDNRELIEKIKYYLSHEEEAQRIADNGYKKLLQYHTTDKRAAEFLSFVGEYL